MKKLIGVTLCLLMSSTVAFANTIPKKFQSYWDAEGMGLSMFVTEKAVTFYSDEYYTSIGVILRVQESTSKRFKAVMEWVDSNGHKSRSPFEMEYINSDTIKLGDSKFKKGGDY